MSDLFDNMRDRAASLLDNANEGLERGPEALRLRQEIKSLRQRIADQLATLGRATLDLYRRDALPVESLAEQCRQVVALEETLAELEAALVSSSVAAADALCEACGSPLAANALFCNQCGTAVPTVAGSEEEEQPAVAPGTRRLALCDECGTPLREGAGFCDTCGRAVAQEGDAAPEKTVVEPAPDTGTRLLATCASCGTPLAAGTDSCPECGQPVATADTGGDPREAKADLPPENSIHKTPPVAGTPEAESGATRLLGNCRGCGAVLDEGASFCSECGRSVTGPVPGSRPEEAAPGSRHEPDRSPAGQEPKAATVAPRRCTHCGQTVRTSSPFCPACGGPLSDEPAPSSRSGVRMHCGIVLEPHISHCPQCGTAVPTTGAGRNPAAGGRAAATVICPDCHTSFRAGTLFCPACGYFMNG